MRPYLPGIKMTPLQQDSEPDSQDNNEGSLRKKKSRAKNRQKKRS